MGRLLPRKELGSPVFAAFRHDVSLRSASVQPSEGGESSQAIPPRKPLFDLDAVLSLSKHTPSQRRSALDQRRFDGLPFKTSVEATTHWCTRPRIRPISVPSWNDATGWSSRHGFTTRCRDTSVPVRRSSWTRRSIDRRAATNHLRPTIRGYLRQSEKRGRHRQVDQHHLNQEEPAEGIPERWYAELKSPYTGTRRQPVSLSPILLGPG
jgi:hypothetical protein